MTQGGAGHADSVNVVIRSPRASKGVAEGVRGGKAMCLFSFNSGVSMQRRLLLSGIYCVY